MMEKKTETTIVYWMKYWRMEKKVEIFIMGYIGFHDVFPANALGFGSSGLFWAGCTSGIL